MAGASLLALLDDIATVLDDVAVLSKVAAKKSAGVLVLRRGAKEDEAQLFLSACAAARASGNASCEDGLITRICAPGHGGGDDGSSQSMARGTLSRLVNADHAEAS